LSPEIAKKRSPTRLEAPLLSPSPQKHPRPCGLFVFRQATCEVGRDMEEPGTRIDPTSSHAGDDLRADALMPAQFYPARRGSAEIEPIMRLMGGILADAVRCFQRNFDATSPSRRQEFREARSWIFNRKADGPFSFAEVCETLDIDPTALEGSDYSMGEKQKPRRQAPNDSALRGQHRRPAGVPSEQANQKRFVSSNQVGDDCFADQFARRPDSRLLPNPVPLPAREGLGAGFGLHK